MSEKPNYMQLLVAIGLFTLVTGLVLGVAHRRDLLQLSPISTYQGIHPSFEAIRYEGNLYTTENPYDASVCYIGPATMNWDPDKAEAEKPNVRGELRDIQIIDDLGEYEVQATLSHIITDFDGVYEPDRPYKTYQWKVDQDGDGWKEKNYRMELWLTSLEVNIFVDPDRGGLFTWSREIADQHYNDLDIWLKLEASQDWGKYFNDPLIDNTYFGLAYLELADISTPEDHTRLTVVPGSRWTAFDLYDSLGGTPKSPDEPDQQGYIYEGTELNPNVFKSEWYTKISIGDLGTYDHNPITNSFKSDTVQVKMLGHIFVVGEWVTKPPSKGDADEPDAPNVDPPWIDNPITKALMNLSENLSTPFGRVKLGIMLSVLIVMLIVIIYPQLIITIGRNWGNAIADVEQSIRARDKDKT